MKVYNWNPNKNRELLESRNISFEKAVFYIDNGGLLDDIVHPNTKEYPHQNIFILQIEDYVYLVPYVESGQGVFLKTIIPSRKFTKGNLYQFMNGVFLEANHALRTLQKASNILDITGFLRLALHNFFRRNPLIQN